MGSQTPPVVAITVDNTHNSCHQSQLTELLAGVTRRLASELTTVRPPADPDPDPDHPSFPLTIFAPAFEPKTGVLDNIKVLISATEHLRCTLTALNLLADLKPRAIGQWRHNLAAARSQVRSGAKSKKNRYYNNNKRDSERRLIAELLGRLFGDITAAADDLRAVREQRGSLLRELRKEKAELEEKLSSHIKWGKRWSAIYTTALFAVLAGSVVLAAVAAPAPAMTAATGASTAMRAGEPLFNSMWDDRKTALEGEKDVIEVMVRDASAQLRALDSVRARIDELKVEVSLVIGRGGNAGSSFFEEVDKGIEALGDMADGIEGDVKKAAADFVRMIANET